MSQPFNPALPTEDFFKQIDDGQMLMDAANTPFTENQLITKAFNPFFVTGVHNDACKEWRRKAPADKRGLFFANTSLMRMKNSWNYRRQHNKPDTLPTWQKLMCKNRKKRQQRRRTDPPCPILPRQTRTFNGYHEDL
eukprot:2795707-Ditylum_brightwellii.AAC.1